MTTAFPGALDAFDNPSSNSQLSSATVPHAAQHANANDAIEALQAKVGIDNSADPTSLDYRVDALENKTQYSGVESVAFANGGTITNVNIIDPDSVVHARLIHFRVKNNTGAPLAKGAPVRFVGYNTGEDAFEVAAGNNTLGVCIGVMEEALASGAFGDMMSSGVLHNVDTSAWSQGSILYPNASGGFTATSPTTGYAQPLAFVLRSHASSGHLQVLADYPKQSADDVRYLTGGSATTVEAALTTLIADLDAAEAALATAISDLNAVEAEVDTIQSGDLAFPKLLLLNTAKVQRVDEQGGTPYYGWKDLIGDITPKTTGLGAPTLDAITGNVRGFRYSVGDDGDCIFHIPHDYAPGTDVFLHYHWTHNGTAISGSFAVTHYLTYAKGHQQASFHAQKTLTITDGSLTIGAAPQLAHRIVEAQASTPGGSASMIDTNLIETDGIIIVHFDVTTIPTISGGGTNEPFLLTLDFHYQSISTGTTKNKVPPFVS